MLDDAAACHLLEINCSPRLGVDGVEPIDKEAPPANPKDICRCPDHPRPHTHYTDDVDRAVKSHVLGGALLLLARQRPRAGPRASTASRRSRLGICVAEGPADADAPGLSAVPRELSDKLTVVYDKVIGGRHSRGRTRGVRPSTADSQEAPGAAGDGAEGAEKGGKGGEGGEGGEGAGDFSLLRRVQELYVRVGGSKRKIDGV